MLSPDLGLGLSLTTREAGGCKTPSVVLGGAVKRSGTAGSSRVTASASVAAFLSATVAGLALVGLVIGEVALSRGGRGDLGLLRGGGLAFALGVISATAVGVVLLRSHPGHPVGWCFAALGTSVAVTGAAQSYGSWGLFVNGGAPLAGSAALVASSGFIVWQVLLGLVCALTPDGRPLSRRWAWVTKALVVCGLLWLVTAVLSPGNLDQAPFSDVDNPYGRDVPGLPALRGIGAIGTSLLLVACVVSLIIRFRRARGEERRRLLWMVVGVVPVPAIVAVMFTAAVTGADFILDVTAGLFVALLPVSAALAITRYHLYDVDRVLSRAVAYLMLSLVLAATYASVVVVVGDGIGGVAGSSTVSVAVATLVAAVAARPLHSLLQDGVDRRFSRRRYDALRTVRAHIAAPAPDSDIEEVLREALSDPSLSVAYWVPDREQWVNADGHGANPEPTALAVERAGRRVAAVMAGPGSTELLTAVVREAEPALENAGLRAAVALQLQEVTSSRARIASAQLQERRRIERDLHDGAQQRLLALATQLQAALLNGDPERQQAALRRGVEQSRAAVQELRSLANGLHPALLSEGGLGAALDDLATRLPVRVHLAEPDRRWPPELEATAWFVACEAVTNAVKHSGASSVQVDVAVQGESLVLRVVDDGYGGADSSGGGLRGLNDRVEAVGGSLSVASSAAGGTCVEAVLPCGS